MATVKMTKLENTTTELSGKMESMEVQEKRQSLTKEYP